MISVVVLATKGDLRLSDCLASLLWCDERVVVIDQSDTRVNEAVEKCKAVSIQRDLQGDFAAQRNFGLAHTSHEWVLFIDSDEVVTTNLAKEIQEFLARVPVDVVGGRIKRVDTMWGQKIRFGENKRNTFLRLGKKSSGTWKGKVHEVWDLRGRTTTFVCPLEHYPHQALSEFLSEINFYTDIRAKELFDQKVRVSFWQIIFYPAVKFLQNYILFSGFRDGVAGIIIAFCMSLHSFLVRSKLFLYRK